MTDLIERLRAMRERALWTQIEGFDPVRQKVSTLINPDGPEAADEIERLRQFEADHQAMRDELEAAKSGYENLLADTNGEIAGLRAEVGKLRGALQAAPSPVQQADMDWALQGEIERLRAELDQYKEAVRLADDLVLGGQYVPYCLHRHAMPGAPFALQPPTNPALRSNEFEVSSWVGSENLKRDEA